jgi:hypothetical protein
MSNPDLDRELRHDLTALLPRPPARHLTLEEDRRIAARLDLLVRRDNAAQQRRERHSVLASAAVVVGCVASVAVWAALAIGGGGASSPIDRSRPIAAAPAAVVVLQRASQAALVSQTSAVSVGDNQFAYTRSTVISNEGGYGGQPFLGAPHKREIWMSQDRDPVSEIGIIREFGQDWPMDAGIAAPPSVVRPTYEWLDALPTDPDDLLTEIESDVAIGDSNGDRDQVVFNRIGTLVVEGLVPADVTSALFDAVTRIPGVATMSNATDALGRQGIGISRSDGTLRSVWVFDPQSYEVLGTRDYFVMPGADLLIGASAILERGVVDQVGMTPNGSTA